MDSAFGLPLHPLVVHGAVVMLPLAAIGVIAVAVAPKLRARFSGLVVLLAAAAAALMPLAQESGESLMRGIEFTAATSEHVEIGETGVAAGAAVLVSAVLLWWMQRRPKRSRAWFGKAIVVIAVVASLAATVQIVRIGHTGATSVWEDVVIPPGFDED